MNIVSVILPFIAGSIILNTFAKPTTKLTIIDAAKAIP